VGGLNRGALQEIKNPHETMHVDAWTITNNKVPCQLTIFGRPRCGNQALMIANHFCGGQLCWFASGQAGKGEQRALPL
jgi:hypothetical protein